MSRVRYKTRLYNTKKMGYNSLQRTAKPLFGGSNPPVASNFWYETGIAIPGITITGLIFLILLFPGFKVL
jgi:hypothetical protein